MLGPTLHASALNANLVKRVVDGVQEVFLPDDDLIEKVANSVASTCAASNAQLLEHVNELQQMVSSMQVQMCQPTSFMPQYPLGYNYHGTPFGGGRGRGQGRGTPFSNPRRYHKYCWTHGACAHDSPQCKSKKTGHKDEATFQNKMGGSTANCNQRNVNGE